MTTFIRNLLQAPSAQPATDNAGSTFLVAHRRVNLDGFYTAPSPTQNTNLPANITPQEYSDTSQVLRDEFIVSDDDGTTWRIVPRGNELGTQAVPAFSGSWSVADLDDNQVVALGSLSFGEFSTSQEPQRTFWILNDGPFDINSLTFNVLRTVDQQIYSELLGKISFETLGKFAYDGAGIGAVGGDTDLLLYNPPPASLNTLQSLLEPGEAVLVRLSFLNFPVNTSLSAIDAEISIITNQELFPLSLDSRWPRGCIQFGEAYQLSPVIEDGEDSGFFTLNDLAINLGNSLLINPGDGRQFDTPLTDDVRLEALVSGGFRVVDAADTVNDEVAIPIAAFTLSGAGVVTNLDLLAGVKPETSIWIDDETPSYRFVELDSSLELTPGNTAPIGVSLPYTVNGTNIATSGFALVESSGAIAVGGTVSANADGTVSEDTSDIVGRVFRVFDSKVIILMG